MSDAICGFKMMKIITIMSLERKITKILSLQQQVTYLLSVSRMTLKEDRKNN